MSGKGKVLIMDDEEVVRKVASRMLSRMGYAVVETPDGQSMVDEYKRAFEAGEPVNVVIMDLTIPGGMGGEEAIRHLLEIDGQAKVIVSSGYTDDPIMADFRTYGFSGVLVKPYRFEELVKAVEALIAK